MQAPEWKMTPPKAAPLKGGGAQHAPPSEHAPATTGEALRRATQRPSPLPRRDAASATNAIPAGTAVLLVDDEPDILLSMREVVALLLPGTLVLTSGSGKDALLAVESDPSIRAVVTDYQMQGMDGLELAEAVHRSHPRLPVVVVSGFTGSDTRDLSMARGAFAFLPKPFAAQTFVETLKAALAVSPAPPPAAALDQQLAEAEAEERQEEDRNGQDAVQDTEEDAAMALQDAADDVADGGRTVA